MKVFSFLMLLSILFLCSCSSQKAELATNSPDGTQSFLLKAEKATFADPWQVIFQLKGKEFPDAPMVEIYASELNDKNVIFNWEDNTTVKIKFIQQDDTERIIKVAVTDESLRVFE